jgi:hypothetical protein
MKKAILTLIFNLIVIVLFAQNADKEKRLKYVSLAPDGTIAMTIYNDTTSNNIKLESAIDFYKYEILDINSSETVYHSINKGKTCIFDVSNLVNGSYKLRIYTDNFVITSNITILRAKNFDKILRKDGIIAQGE